MMLGRPFCPARHTASCNCPAQRRQAFGLARGGDRPEQYGGQTSGQHADPKELANATVTICHTGTRNLAGFTRQADVVIAAAGRPNTLTADMIREGAVVIDVGVNRVEDAARKAGYRLVGDVDFERVREKASLITPVPGGVGPMTIAMLLYNTVQAAKKRCPGIRGRPAAP